MKTLLAALAVVALATPAFAQTPTERAHSVAVEAAKTAREMTVLLGLCQPSLSENHWTVSRAFMVGDMRLPVEAVDGFYAEAVALREAMTPAEAAEYGPLECRVVFNDLKRRVESQFGEALRLYEEAAQ